MNQSILVYSQLYTPRVEYIFSHILGSILGLRVCYTQSIDEATGFQGPVINYSTQAVEGAFCISPHEILFQSSVLPQAIEPIDWLGSWAFFPAQGESHLPFDIFAASFYLLSRYEECLPYTPDNHGRFTAQASLAVKHNFLHLPLVDIWVQQFAKHLVKHYPLITLASRRASIIPTIDIDNAYAYRHKGLVRVVLGTLASLAGFRGRDFFQRIPVYMGLRSDPFDCYSSLFQTLALYPQSVWFILGGPYGHFDKHIPIANKAMTKLLREISERYTVGVHPSYGSFLSGDRVGEEIAELLSITGCGVRDSRQHYLRMKLPDSYRILAQLGIERDYTMGYPNMLGFRASTCIPYPFFDVANNRELPLIVVPFQVMDVTLRYSLGLTPTEAVEQCLLMAQEVANVGGTFVPIWHNESLSGQGVWKGWENSLGGVLQSASTVIPTTIECIK
jgi:hypothetical protein